LVFGETNPALRRRINFLNMTSDAIEALPEKELIDQLSQRVISVSVFKDKSAVLNKALSPWNY